MMTVILFFAGMHLMIETLAALYRWVDLWYAIGDHFVGIILRLTIVVGINILLVTMLEGDLLKWFLLGQLGYLAFHICKFFVARMIIIGLGRRQKDYGR